MKLREFSSEVGGTFYFFPIYRTLNKAKPHVDVGNNVFLNLAKGLWSSDHLSLCAMIICFLACYAIEILYCTCSLFRYKLLGSRDAAKQLPVEHCRVRIRIVQKCFQGFRLKTRSFREELEFVFNPHH